VRVSLRRSSIGSAKMASSKVMTSPNSGSRKSDLPRRAPSSSATATKPQSLSDQTKSSFANANRGTLGSSSMTVDGLLRTVYDSKPSATESTLLDAQITVIDTPAPVQGPSDSKPNVPKTVDEVWREIVSGDRRDCKEEAPEDEMMTLEDFLAQAGSLEDEDMKVEPNERLSGGVFSFDPVPTNQFAALDSMEGAIVGFGNGVEVIAGAGASAGRGKRSRVVMEPLDKAAQQRQRRMIKNRESAARSRERKQVLYFLPLLGLNDFSCACILV
jgi:ABA responsive element binding factor